MKLCGLFTKAGQPPPFASFSPACSSIPLFPHQFIHRQAALKMLSFEARGNHQKQLGGDHIRNLLEPTRGIRFAFVFLNNTPTHPPTIIPARDEIIKRGGQLKNHKMENIMRMREIEALTREKHKVSPHHV